MTVDIANWRPADWTINVRGDVAFLARKAGYNACHARGVTAIEVCGATKSEAMRIAGEFGVVLYAFE